MNNPKRMGGKPVLYGKSVTGARYMSYPKADDIESGCKVGWMIYTDRDAAQQCAVAAKHNAQLRWEDGFDFGYCSPGSIDTKADGRFRVCIP